MSVFSDITASNIKRFILQFHFLSFRVGAYVLSTPFLIWIFAGLFAALTVPGFEDRHSFSFPYGYFDLYETNVEAWFFEGCMGFSVTTVCLMFSWKLYRWERVVGWLIFWGYVYVFWRLTLHSDYDVSWLKVFGGGEPSYSLFPNFFRPSEYTDGTDTNQLLQFTLLGGFFVLAGYFYKICKDQPVSEGEKGAGARFKKFLFGMVVFFGIISGFLFLLSVFGAIFVCPPFYCTGDRGLAYIYIGLTWPFGLLGAFILFISRRRVCGAIERFLLRFLAAGYLTLLANLALGFVWAVILHRYGNIFLGNGPSLP